MGPLHQFTEKGMDWKAIYLGGNGATKYGPPYTQDGYSSFAPDLEIICQKCAHLLNLTDQNWKFAPIYRKSDGLESNLFGW